MARGFLGALFGGELGYRIVIGGFGRFTLLLRLWHYRRDIDPDRRNRLRLIMLVALLSAPLRLLERLVHGRRIARTRIAAVPIFIIGHWRSGTTHLHNLMSQDPALGYLSMYQAVAPGCSLVGGGWLKALLARMMPLKRPMDEMIWPMDAPQEEEVALAKMTPHSFYVQMLFPRRARELFRRYVLLDGAPAEIGAEIQDSFLQILRIATLHAGGKRLVLKNPVNTARIPLLLALFPDAKFICAHRDPYAVYVSTVHLHRTVFAEAALQRTPDMAEIVLANYEDLMRRYFADRGRIPAGNLVEVRFEDLEREPLGEMRRIYQTLGLAGYAEAEPAIRAYVEAQKSYRKNSFTLAEADRARIAERWGFAFRELGYPLATPSAVAPVA